MNARRALVAVLLVLGSAHAVVAQGRPAGSPRWQAPALAPGYGFGTTDSLGRSYPVDTPLLVLGGLVGGAAGLLGGGAVGYAFGGGGRLCGDDPCGLEGGLLGAVGGEMLFLPLGVHLANHSRGNYGYSLLASVGLGLLGTGLASTANSGALLLAVPIAQLASSIIIERATSRPRKTSR